MKLTNRIFIISGGSSGLGLATVQALLRASDSVNVAILDLTGPTTLNFMSLGPRVKFVKCDVTKLEEIQDAVDACVKWTKESGRSLGGAICCAGVGTVAKIIDANGEPHSLDLWNFAIAVNLTGTFNLIRLVIKHLVSVPPEEPDGERGVIIMVSSSAAFEGQPGQAAYSATKGALSSMTLPLARDLARHGIRVVTIAPGVFSQ